MDVVIHRRVRRVLQAQTACVDLTVPKAHQEEMAQMLLHGHRHRILTITSIANQHHKGPLVCPVQRALRGFQEHVEPEAHQAFREHQEREDHGVHRDQLVWLEKEDLRDRWGSPRRFKDHRDQLVRLDQGDLQGLLDHLVELEGQVHQVLGAKRVLLV